MTKQCKTCRFRNRGWSQEECGSCEDFDLWMPLKEESNQKSCYSCKFRDLLLSESPCEMCKDKSMWASNTKTNQNAKADAGKPDPTLVPRQIIWDIAVIREYGNRKYGSADNWKTVEPERYRAAAMRHMLAYLDDPTGVDEESGKPHLWHLACNVSFLCEMEGEKWMGNIKK